MNARLPPELLQMYRDEPIGHPDMSELRDQLFGHIDAVEFELASAEHWRLRHKESIDKLEARVRELEEKLVEAESWRAMELKEKQAAVLRAEEAEARAARWLHHGDQARERERRLEQKLATYEKITGVRVKGNEP